MCGYEQYDTKISLFVDIFNTNLKCDECVKFIGIHSTHYLSLLTWVLKLWLG